jgi:hypothetical protein
MAVAGSVTTNTSHNGIQADLDTPVFFPQQDAAESEHEPKASHVGYAEMRGFLAWHTGSSSLSWESFRLITGV